MTKKDYQHSPGDKFQRKAERLTQILSSEAENGQAPASVYDIQKLLHELHVHQVELQTQNEELRRAHEELDASRAQFFDLFEMAPVGYLTICANGLICEANLTASSLLGQPRSFILNQPFARFVSPDDVENYHKKQKIAFETFKTLNLEVRMLKPDQTVFWAQLVFKALEQGDNNRVSRLIISDITERKSLELALHESEERYRYLFESASDAMLVIDSESGQVVDANRRSLELYQYTEDELKGMRCWERAATEKSSSWLRSEIHSKPDGILTIPMHLHKKKDGSVFPAEITARSLFLNGKQRFFMAIRDISLRWHTQKVIAARMRLLKTADSLSLNDLLRQTLDEAEALTESQIGFFHIVDTQHKTMSHQSWSSNTIEHLCKADRSDRHYSIEQAGLWAECIHRRRPVIHNDCASLPQRKELPMGHVEIIRELVVPVMRNDVVVALIGLGNKPTDYTEQDVRIVTILADLAWDIALRKRAETDLRENEERYRLLFEAASDALFFIDADTGQILQANEQALAMYGYSQQDLLGMDLVNLSAEKEKTLQCLKDTVSDRDALVHVPLRLHRKKGGAIFPVDITGRGVPYKGQSRLLLSVRDITERVSAENALHLSEQKRLEEQKIANAQLREHAENLSSIYRALDSVGLIVCDLMDDDARIRVFNVGAEQLFGYLGKETLGESIGLIYPSEQLDLIPGRVQELRKGNAIESFNMTLVRSSGERFPAVVSVHPFSCRDNHYRKSIGIFRDISDIIQVQQQLEAINENLERLVEERTRELQESQKQVMHAEKLSAIGLLSASIAHEFNNPLQGIMIILNGLKKRAPLSDWDRKMLDAAISESERMKDLIRSLQDFNRPSSGKKGLMSLHAAIESLLLIVTNTFWKRRIKVERNFAHDLPEIVAIPDQIKQVLLNLLNNACDACNSHGGVVTITTWRDGDKVAVAIKDTGTGIAPENLDRIFQPFYSTKNEVKGTGLGLSVSHGIVQAHGGTIQAESRLGEGATFTVFLPIKEAKEGELG